MFCLTRVFFSEAPMYMHISVSVWRYIEIAVDVYTDTSICKEQKVQNLLWPEAVRVNLCHIT